MTDETMQKGRIPRTTIRAAIGGINRNPKNDQWTNGHYSERDNYADNQIEKDVPQDNPLAQGDRHICVIRYQHKIAMETN